MKQIQGWVVACFPVGVRSETQQLQDFEVLGFVPQPNLHLHQIFREMVLGLDSVKLLRDFQKLNYPIFQNLIKKLDNCNLEYKLF